MRENLQTGRLRLRRWREDDAETLYEYAKNPNIGPAAGWPVHTGVENSLEIIRGVLSEKGTYAITESNNDHPIGSIGLMTGAQSNLGIPGDEAEIGYWLAEPFWGRGYIPEAAAELMRYAFEDLEIKRIWCGYFDGNDKSKRVNQKCGFVHQHSEERYWELIDATKLQHITSLTKEQWQALNNKE